MYDDTELTLQSEAAPTRSDATYSKGLSRIVDGLRGSIDACIPSALDEHRVLVSSVLARRLMEPLDLPPAFGSTAQPVVAASVSALVATGASVPRRPARTTRELVLEVIATAPEAISFADVVAAVAAAGGSGVSAHEMRTDLLKRGAIVNRRGLYTITDIGQQIRAGFG